jgi:flagellum-specific ATP synthase
MMELAGLTQEIRALPSGLMLGRVSKVVGLIVESTGPEGSVGEQMIIHLGDGRQIMAEVVGFHDHQVMLMPVENWWRPPATSPSCRFQTSSWAG